MWVDICSHVLMCDYICVHILRPKVNCRCLPWSSSPLFWDKVSYSPGNHWLARLAIQWASPKDPSVSTCIVLGLQTCTPVPGPLHECQRSDLWSSWLHSRHFILLIGSPTLPFHFKSLYQLPSTWKHLKSGACSEWSLRKPGIWRAVEREKQMAGEREGLRERKRWVFVMNIQCIQEFWSQWCLNKES